MCSMILEDMILEECCIILCNEKTKLNRNKKRQPARRGRRMLRSVLFLYVFSIFYPSHNFIFFPQLNQRPPILYLSGAGFLSNSVREAARGHKVGSTQYTPAPFSPPGIIIALDFDRAQTGFFSVRPYRQPIGRVELFFSRIARPFFCCRTISEGSHATTNHKPLSVRSRGDLDPAAKLKYRPAGEVQQQ